MDTTPIILDVDPGHDDAVAMLLAAASPAIDVLAVTCVAGNAPLANTQENARKVLTVAGVTDVPVAAGLLDYYARFHQDLYGWDGVPLHDPCCVAALIQPGLITTKAMDVQIETTSALTLGRTVCDVWGVTGRTPNVDIGVAIDRQGFIDVLMDCLGRY